MLVLNRHIGESVIIDDNEIIVTVLKVDRKTGRVKLGFTADEEVKIHREELFRKIKREQERDDV